VEFLFVLGSSLILVLNHLGLGRLRALGTRVGIAMDEAVA